MFSVIVRWQKRFVGKLCEYLILFLIKKKDFIKELLKVYFGFNCSVYVYVEINIKFYIYMLKINMYKFGKLLLNYYQCRLIFKINIYKIQQLKVLIFLEFSFFFNFNNEWLFC